MPETELCRACSAGECEHCPHLFERVPGEGFTTCECQCQAGTLHTSGKSPLPVEDRNDPPPVDTSDPLRSIAHRVIDDGRRILDGAKRFLEDEPRQDETLPEQLLRFFGK